MFENLPNLKETIQQFKLLAKKSLGQNFLLNMDTVRRVARAGGDLSQVTVIEVGPGPGGLTRALLEQGAQRVIAIEKDPRCLEVLQQLQTIVLDRLMILNVDALSVVVQDLAEGPLKIVANLPYNVGTPLLIQWLHHLDRIQSMTLMFQKEVAMRIIAKPKTNAYGRLSIICQYLCEVEKAFDLPAGAFSPPPKVTSSVVVFYPKVLTDEGRSLLPFLEKVTQAAFGQRRKMLRASLKGMFDEADFARVSVASTQRAEDIEIIDFVNLAKVYRLKKEKDDGKS